MDNQFTVGALLKHMLKNAWWIIILGIIGAASLFILENKHAITSYSATRQMYVGQDTKGLKDPNSRVMADSTLLRTYTEAGTDSMIVKATLKTLKSEKIKMTSSELAEDVTLEPMDGTLLISVKATAPTAKLAIKISNAYAENFAKLLPQKLTTMPTPKLLSKVTAAESATMTSGSPKKATVFGFAAGIVLGIILAFFTGIYKNMKASAK